MSPSDCCQLLLPGQDVSLLLDLCRQSIVFLDLCDLVTCLKIVGADQEVQIVRIKNRIDPGYSGAESAGYRNVSLNLRIVTSETIALGIDTHVCELQLLHSSFAKIKVRAANSIQALLRGSGFLYLG